jgi:hypothetical protein
MVIITHYSFSTRTNVNKLKLKIYLIQFLSLKKDIFTKYFQRIHIIKILS